MCYESKTSHVAPRASCSATIPQHRRPMKHASLQKALKGQRLTWSCRKAASARLPASQPKELPQHTRILSTAGSACTVQHA